MRRERVREGEGESEREREREREGLGEFIGQGDCTYMYMYNLSLSIGLSEYPSHFPPMQSQLIIIILSSLQQHSPFDTLLCVAMDVQNTESEHLSVSFPPLWRIDIPCPLQSCFSPSKQDFLNCFSANGSINQLNNHVYITSACFVSPIR